MKAIRAVSLVWVCCAIVNRPMAAQPAALARPMTERQQEFLSWRFGLFLHFNMGTFANLEWAGGYEDPAMFRPDQLDCSQWADAAVSAGMKYAVLTVKHTDGFCLWDSKYTTHDVASVKAFRDGRGDVVREFVDAFRKRRLKVGFYYCFPGNYMGTSWGTNLPPGKLDLHGLPPEAQGDYLGFIHKQLEELLTRYGPIDVLWCDQYANAYTGAKWPETLKYIHALQPNCLVIANNSHNLAETDIVSFEFPLGKEVFPAEDNQLPAEVCDNSSTAGWFWHPNTDAALRTAQDILDILDKCNQRNANYLLDVGPDRRGRIPDAAVKLLAEVGASRSAGDAGYQLFTPTNLVAWCIVPFDAKKRGPEERAAMLEKLGFKMFAYDYRAEHIPTFDAEIEALQRHHVRLLAWWFPGALNDEARLILNVLQRHGLRDVQLWVTGGGEPAQTPAEQAARVAAEAERLKPIAAEAGKIGCTVALYNHGAWFGEPENQLEIIARLRAQGMTNVGIVYNLHHGHDHLDRFPALLQKMKPCLLALNLNGMVRDGEKSGKKILVLGRGDLDRQLLRTIRDSGWRGPIGLLNHTDEDAETRLRENLDGLRQLAARLDARPAP